MMVKDHRGDFFAVRRAGWAEIAPEVECWPGPNLPAKMCARAKLKIVRCGAVLVDMGGRFDCLPPGITVL